MAWVFSWSVSYIKSIPTHEILFAEGGGKGGPSATFNLFFSWVGLGWPWVGEFVGFVVMFICFPTHHNLVNRIHPNTLGLGFAVRHQQVGLVTVAVLEGVHVGDDGYSRFYEGKQGQGPVAPREVSRIAFGSCT